MRKPAGLFGLLVLIVATAFGQSTAKNVILFIGDGIGIPTLNAAGIYGYNKPRALFVYQAAHVALAETSSASHWVTDSAAAMTAIVTGEKTKNGVLSLSSSTEPEVRDGEVLKTILEYAEERGLSTGIITNEEKLSTATAAACFAHVNHRHKFREIYDQFLAPRFGDGVDLVIAPRGGPSDAMEPDQLAQLPERGYRTYEQIADLENYPADSLARTIVFLPGPDFDLGTAVTQAVRLLRRNPRGFFLMVESNAHFRDVPKMMRRTVELDNVIRETVARCKSDTLVLFTSDHSYDLRIPNAPVNSEIVPHIKVEPFHTAEEVLVAAEGPGSEQVRGVLANSDLFRIMLAAYGWKP